MHIYCITKQESYIKKLIYKTKIHGRYYIHLYIHKDHRNAPWHVFSGLWWREMFDHKWSQLGDRFNRHKQLVFHTMTKRPERSLLLNMFTMKMDTRSHVNIIWVKTMPVFVEYGSRSRSRLVKSRQIYRENHISWSVKFQVFFMMI